MTKKIEKLPESLTTDEFNYLVRTKLNLLIDQHNEALAPKQQYEVDYVKIDGEMVPDVDGDMWQYADTDYVYCSNCEEALDETTLKEVADKFAREKFSPSEAPNAAPKFTVHSIHNIEDKVMFDGERFSISKEHFRLLEKPALELEALKARMREARELLHSVVYYYGNTNKTEIKYDNLQKALALLLSDDGESK